MTVTKLATSIFALLLPLLSLGQIQNMIVAQYQRVDTISGSYDVWSGYSESLQDSVRILRLASGDSIDLGLEGDSIGFFILPEQADWSKNLKPIVRKAFPNQDTAFYYVSIRYLCSKRNNVSAHDGSFTLCQKTNGPLYYLDGRPIFSEDKKENRRLKRAYRKFRLKSAFRRFFDTLTWKKTE